MLRKAVGQRQQVNCGRFIVSDAYRNILVRHHIALEAYARDVGVLRAGESGAE